MLFANSRQADVPRGGLIRGMEALHWPIRMTGYSLWYFDHSKEKVHMTWTTPTLVEICIGLEINAYLPAEF